MTDSVYRLLWVKTIDDIDGQLASFFVIEAQKLSESVDGRFNGGKAFDFLSYARGSYLLVIYRNNEPVGVSLSRLYPSIFDERTRILKQDLIYVKPNSGRAAYLLMQQFIAFGKKNADHILTSKQYVGTNMKPRSLEKLGFKEVETLYRLEVGNES